MLSALLSGWEDPPGGNISVQSWVMGELGPDLPHEEGKGGTCGWNPARCFGHAACMCAFWRTQGFFIPASHTGKPLSGRGKFLQQRLPVIRDEAPGVRRLAWVLEPC